MIVKTRKGKLISIPYQVNYNSSNGKFELGNEKDKFSQENLVKEINFKRSLSTIPVNKIETTGNRLIIVKVKKTSKISDLPYSTGRENLSYVHPVMTDIYKRMKVLPDYLEYILPLSYCKDFSTVIHWNRVWFNIYPSRNDNYKVLFGENNLPVLVISNDYLEIYSVPDWYKKEFEINL